MDFAPRAPAYGREAVKSDERPIKLFKSDIPRTFELPGEDATTRKEGGKLIIDAAPSRSLLAILEGLEPIDEDFPPINDSPPEPCTGQ